MYKVLMVRTGEAVGFYLLALGFYWFHLLLPLFLYCY